MLSRLYVEALLRDALLADAVWGVWDAGLIPDEVAAIAWWQIAMSAFTESGRSASST
jgi:hypothetical protein